MAQGMREMVVESVRVHMLSSQHVVILREAEAGKHFPAEDLAEVRAFLGDPVG